MAVRGRYFQGLLYIVKKGCEKGKIAGYGGENSGGFANEKSWHGVGILAGICWTKSRVPAFPRGLGGGVLVTND